ncbi:hypothetical protein [Streptomyces sp. NPDC048584]|uniref:hypothetical protein n=1 Tax=Streptomyces sp. NPDC048584 TaxID=3365573 RepID=UPI0037146EBB
MTDTPWKTYAEMIAEVDRGWRQTSVQELLAVAGERKAGRRIIAAIERELAAQRVGYFPTQLPTDQTAFVLLYNQDLQGVGSLLHLVRQLTETGTSTNSQIITLHALLHQLQAKPAEDATPE